MTVYRDFDEIPRDENTVLTLGAFDGGHRGHQSIFKRLLDVSKNEGLRNVLITIDPHPQIVLQKSDRQQLQLLTTIKERLEIFEAFGIENVLVIPFSYEFSLTPPEVFIKEYLWEKVGFKKILIGHDHMFGKNREGNIELLKSLSAELKFEIEEADVLEQDDIIVSSTKIRRALDDHQIDTANKMLGYDYMVRGKVVHGNGRGVDIGYPTANIKTPDIYKLLPANGVYLVSTKIDGVKYFGMANIGVRPTLTNDVKPTLEVNLFDFDEDVYGKELSVHFHTFIRKEIKFKNLDALIHQIEKDEMECRDLVEKF